MTQSMHILNFFASSSGFPSCTRSDIIFSELKFHQEQLVELFVQVSSEISFIRIESSVRPKRMTPSTVPSTFL